MSRLTKPPQPLMVLRKRVFYEILEPKFPVLRMDSVPTWVSELSNITLSH